LNDVKIKKIAAGQTSACITETGDLFLWGKTTFGVFAKPEKVIAIPTAIDDVSLGNTVSIAKDINGMLWGWGNNKHGELGFGDKEPRVNPCPVFTLKGKQVTQISCGG